MERRESKKQATRERLLAEAARLFVKHGYESTSVDMVAEAADVSRATAFNYFPRKEDFFLEWSAARRAAMAESLAQHGDATELSAVTGAMRSLAVHYATDPYAKGFVRCWLEAGGPLLPEARESAEFFRRIVASAQRRGQVAPGVNAATAGRALLSIFLGAVYDWAAADRSAQWLRRELAGAVEPFLRGLAA